jgi:hypothetical protein
LLAVRLFYHDFYMQDVSKTRIFEVSKKEPKFVERKQTLLHSLRSAIFPDRKINKVSGS